MQTWHRDNQIQAASDGAIYAHFYKRELDQKKLFATFTAVPDAAGRYIGKVARVNPNDNGSKAIGRDISRGRALKALAEKRGLVNPSRARSARDTWTFENEDEVVDFIRSAKVLGDPLFVNLPITPAISYEDIL